MFVIPIFPVEMRQSIILTVRIQVFSEDLIFLSEIRFLTEDSANVPVNPGDTSRNTLLFSFPYQQPVFLSSLEHSYIISTLIMSVQWNLP